VSTFYRQTSLLGLTSNDKIRPARKSCYFNRGTVGRNGTDAITVTDTNNILLQTPPFCWPYRKIRKQIVITRDIDTCIFLHNISRLWQTDVVSVQKLKAFHLINFCPNANVHNDITKHNFLFFKHSARPSDSTAQPGIPRT